MILVMAVVPPLSNIMVPFHLLAALIHVVVVSLLLHFNVVVPLLLGLHVVVPLVHLLLLVVVVVHHLGALTELGWRLVEVVRMLQLVNRRRLVLNVVAGMVARWWLLHLCLLLWPLLWLLLDVRMLGLVASLVMERHGTSVPHAGVAERMISHYCF